MKTKQRVLLALLAAAVSIILWIVVALVGGAA